MSQRLGKVFSFALLGLFVICVSYVLIFGKFGFCFSYRYEGRFAIYGIATSSTAYYQGKRVAEARCLVAEKLPNGALLTIEEVHYSRERPEVVVFKGQFKVDTTQHHQDAFPAEDWEQKQVFTTWPYCHNNRPTWTGVIYP